MSVQEPNETSPARAMVGVSRFDEGAGSMVLPAYMSLDGTIGAVSKLNGATGFVPRRIQSGVASTLASLGACF